LVVDEAGLSEALRAIDESPPGSVAAVVGPTASGKTDLAVSLAERIGGEVVSADSVQVYRRFDVGSGKPTKEEEERARHHLVGVKDPLDGFDAALYAEAAERAIVDILARGKRPIVCGGTFLWIKALFFGLAHAAPANAAIRSRHHEEVERDGRASLHGRLAKVDPTLAQRLHPNDVVRVSRGLEVFELTGRPLSSWQGEHGFISARRPAVLLALRRSPDELTTRIARRVDAWLASGWIEEVEGLVAEGYGQARAMQSVGYREVAEHLAGRLGRNDLREAIVRSTRVFARRQRTWLNHAEVLWLTGASS
jgi:tRNA dimethylallyltransferase